MGLLVLKAEFFRYKKSNSVQETACKASCFFICPTCKTQVWGKPDIKILCGMEDCKSITYEVMD